MESSFPQSKARKLSGRSLLGTQAVKTTSSSMFLICSLSPGWGPSLQITQNWSKQYKNRGSRDPRGLCSPWSNTVPVGHFWAYRRSKHLHPRCFRLLLSSTSAVPGCSQSRISCLFTNQYRFSMKSRMPEGVSEALVSFGTERTLSGGVREAVSDRILSL